MAGRYEHIVPASLRKEYIMDFDLVVSLLPKYIRAAGVTIELTIFALVLGLLGGFLMAAMKMSKIKILKIIASVYINIIRGTPLLLQIIFVYYSLPSFGITLQPLQAGIIAMTINEVAYLAETIRSGIEAVEKGQWEAGKVLGYNPVSTMTVIILPQAIRIILPQVGNMAVSLLKDTSLVSTISLTELMRSAQTSYATTFRPLETYLLAGIIYYLLSTMIELIFKKAERSTKAY